MKYNLENLINHEIGLISLIIDFLLGSTAKLNKNTEALKYRLVCRTFRQEIDKRSHLSIKFPIKRPRKNRKHRLAPSRVSSISLVIKYDHRITKKDWNDIFGNKLSTLESSLRYLHVSASYIEYLPKFNCLNSILWDIKKGCYSLLEDIPHKELKINKCCPSTRYNSTINYLTKLSEIKIKITEDFDHKLISEYLPLTISKMIIDMYKSKVDIIDLSKFGSLKYLKIVGYYKQIIEELRLPTSLNELYSSVKIEKMNLYQCKNLGVIELK